MSPEMVRMVVPNPTKSPYKKKSQTKIPILIGMEFALHGCGMKDWAASTHTSVKHMTIAPTKPDHW